MELSSHQVHSNNLFELYIECTNNGFFKIHTWLCSKGIYFDCRNRSKTQSYWTLFE